MNRLIQHGPGPFLESRNKYDACIKVARKSFKAIIEKNDFHQKFYQSLVKLIFFHTFANLGNYQVVMSVNEGRE